MSDELERYGTYTARELRDLLPDLYPRPCRNIIRDLLDAIESRPAADESAKPIYQVTEDDAAWHDTDWMTYESAPTEQRRIVYTHAAPVASKEAVTLSDEQEGMRQATREMILANPEGARLEMAAMAAEIRELKATAVGTLGDADIEKAECIAYKKHGHRAGVEWTRAFAEAILAQRDASKAEPKS